MNVLVTALVNHLFSTLTREEFSCLSVFLNEISKSMYSITLFRDVCDSNRLKASRQSAAQKQGDANN
jgi:hypothetical protein